MTEQNKLKAGDFCEGDLGDGGILIGINDPSLPDALRAMANTYEPARAICRQARRRRIRLVF